MLFTIGESDPWIPIAYPGNDEKGDLTHTHTEEKRCHEKELKMIDRKS
jgi:hypothetical protein